MRQGIPIEARHRLAATLVMLQMTVTGVACAHRQSACIQRTAVFGRVTNCEPPRPGGAFAFRGYFDRGKGLAPWVRRQQARHLPVQEHT